MKEISLLFKTRCQIVIKMLHQANFIKIVAFLLVISSFLAGTYYVIFRVFNYLTTVEIIGMGIIDRTMEMAFFLFFIMLCFSNIITSFSTFYNNRELNLLFTLPIRPTVIYLTKLLENSIYASWATVVIGLPLIFAYGICTKAHGLYYPIALSSMLIYLIMPAAMASIIIFFILSLFPKLTPKLVILIALIFIIVLSLLYIKISNPALLKILETENEQELLNFAANLTTVAGAYLPSTWLANVLKEMKNPNWTAVFYFLLLFFTTISCILVAFFVAGASYHRSYIAIGEQSTKRSRRSSLLSNYQASSKRAFLFKDILLFAREPTQWVQLAIFLILLIIYLFSLRKTPVYFVFPGWRTIVSFANFAYISFVLATLGVRFIYPTVSLEQDGIWLIASSGQRFGEIIKIKYFFNLLLAVVIIEGLLIFANLFIKTDKSLYILMPVIGLFVAASLVSINLGLGTRFPQFNEDNPSRIAAGTGGIIAALASITYVGISIIILAAPAYNYLASHYFNRRLNWPLITTSLIAFLLFNLSTIILPLKIGIRSLERRDF